jgi:preprotein translocase subunit SecE
VARDRQRAKQRQRQQQRREERLRGRGSSAPKDGDGAAGGDAEAGLGLGPDAGKVDPADSAEVGRLAGELGAPPENLGRSDAEAKADLTPEEEDELFLDDEDFKVDQDELAEAEGEAGYAPRGKRGDRAPASGEAAKAGGPARVVAFLRACWAELQRVQWPDRRQTTQLTTIVLVFIVIVGLYLGALDAVVSRVVQEIL